MYLVGNKRADIARVIPCKNNFCTKFAHRFHFCDLQKLNTLNLRLFHPPLNPCNHFPTVLIKANWYTISYKFYGCRSLEEINIPNKVTSIGESAFKNCEALGEKTLSQYDNFLKKEARKKEEERRAREESKRIEEKRKKKIIICIVIFWIIVLALMFIYESTK